MAQDTLKDFSMSGVVGGLLLTCLLAFSIQFMLANNTNGFGDTGDVFDTSYTNQEGALLEGPQDADILLNITANTNPEVSDLGSRDSVATSYSAVGAGKKSWEQAKYLISWVFSGDSGKLLLGVLGGLIGLLSYFFIYKHIRQGN